MQIEAIIKYIEKENLLHRAIITGTIYIYLYLTLQGEYLSNGLDILQKEYPNKLSNQRGIGTFSKSCTINY